MPNRSKRSKKRSHHKVTFRPLDEDTDHEFYARILKYSGSAVVEVVDQYGHKFNLKLRGAIQPRSTKQRANPGSYCLVSASRIHLIYPESVAISYGIDTLFTKKTDDVAFEFNDTPSHSGSDSLDAPDDTPFDLDHASASDVDIDAI